MNTNGMREGIQVYHSLVHTTDFTIFMFTCLRACLTLQNYAFLGKKENGQSLKKCLVMVNKRSFLILSEMKTRFSYACVKVMRFPHLRSSYSRFN